MTRHRLISKHAPLLAAALQSGSHDTVTGALEDMSTDAYQDGNGDDTATVPAGLLATCAVMALNLLGQLAQPDADPDALADSVTADNVAFCTVAGQLDTGTGYTVTADADPCNVCTGHDGDDASDGNAPPWHPGCGCTITPNTDNTEGRSTMARTPNTETRAVTHVETRDGANAGTFIVEGTALAYNTPTRISDSLGSFEEVLRPGMLKSADTSRCVFNANHGVGGSFPLATVRSGSLKLTDTASGLTFRAECDATTPSGIEMRSWLKRNEGECSFAFEVAPNGDTWTGPGPGTHRSIHALARLADVSVVTDPAYTEGTSAGIAARMLSTVTEARSALSARSGRKISAKHKAILSGAMDHLDAATTAIQAVHDADVTHPTGNSAPTAAGSGADGSLNAPFPGGAGPSAYFGNGDGAGSRSVRAVDLTADVYALELRGKYTAAQQTAMLKKGHAIANANGDPSFPIEDIADVKKAIKAVGRAGADHDAVRLHIISSCHRLGCSSLIPNTWNLGTGSLSDHPLRSRVTLQDLEDEVA